MNFSYSLTDGSPSATATHLDITPVNDAPVTAGDAGGDGRGQRRAADHLGRAAGRGVGRRRPGATSTGLTIPSGGGTLVDNGNGTWSYTPALNDDNAVSFSYSVDGRFAQRDGDRHLDITPVNDAPVTTAVTLAAMAEDSGARLITQAELLAKPRTSTARCAATGLTIASGGGTLVDNLNGTWSYTPALNDDSSVSFATA